MAKRSAEEMNESVASLNHNDGSSVEGEGGNRYELLERLKKEKRLAMNRECARVRRKRKKVRMDMLENRVQILNQDNKHLEQTNAALLTRVAQLEREVNQSKASQALMLTGGTGAGMGPFGGNATGVPSSASLLNATNNNNEMDLHQRRAALERLQMLQLLGGGSNQLGGNQLGGALGTDDALLANSRVHTQQGSLGSSASMPGTAGWLMGKR